MSSENNRRSDSSSTVFVVAIIVGLLFVVGLVVAGAGAFFFLAVNRGAVVRTEYDRAIMAQQEQAIEAMQLQAEKTQIEETSDQQDPLSSQREITFTLDEDGNVETGGIPIQLDALRASLRAAAEAPGAAPSVVIQVDHQCLFAHVAALLAVCNELEIDDVRVASSQVVSTP